MAEFVSNSTILLASLHVQFERVLFKLPVKAANMPVKAAYLPVKAAYLPVKAASVPEKAAKMAVRVPYLIPEVAALPRIVAFTPLRVITLKSVY